MNVSDVLADNIHTNVTELYSRSH